MTAELLKYIETIDSGEGADVMGCPREVVAECASVVRCTPADEVCVPGVVRTRIIRMSVVCDVLNVVSSSDGSCESGSEL